MIAVIDYGVGNLFSVEKAFQVLGAEPVVTSDEAFIRAADKLVLPGVGAFGDCVRNFAASGLIPVFREKVRAGVPVLGICVGLQILFDGSEESPGVEGLGLLPGTVRRIPAPGLKIPHMGWNSLTIARSRDRAGLFNDLPEESYVYFVHSYHAVPQDESCVVASTDYGGRLTAAVAKGNLMATQFHPEKSGDVGLTILENFIRI